MSRLIKTDFHLHTCFSDNRDRMTPEEYVELAARFGYAAIGFCDHNHNLTQDAWSALLTAASALSTPDLLVTTGYEATFVTGHLCVLNKRQFDGEEALDCERQMYRPDNLRIVAHPDNNSCAWRLPLPVGVDGVEVINGGQDLYAFRPSSFCNGLHSYQTYLLLNHPVAAFAQSDCHERMIFGRVWTGMWLPDGTPTTWEAVRSAIREQRVFAAMGDISLRVWAGEDADGRPVLRWEAPVGSSITVYCADRPMAYLDPAGTSSGALSPATNGYYWILAKRGLAWAVSSPVRLQPLTDDHPGIIARRHDLLSDSVVRRQTDRLKRRFDQMHSLEALWTDSVFPVQEYMNWLSSLLPEQWQAAELVDGVEELQRRALFRLSHAEALVTALQDDLVRRQVIQERTGEPERVFAVATAPYVPAMAGPVQFTVEVPRDWVDVTLVDDAGVEMNFVARQVDGERDPIHGLRTREQLGEVVTWLLHGEMHEYGLRHVTLTRGGARVEVRFDLYPASLLGKVQHFAQEAGELEELLADPTVSEFHVHTRMPKRLAILLQLDSRPAGGYRAIHVRPARSAGGQTWDRIDYFGSRSLATDPLADGLVVQVS